MDLYSPPTAWWYAACGRWIMGFVEYEGSSFHKLCHAQELIKRKVNLYWMLS